MLSSVITSVFCGAGFLVNIESLPFLYNDNRDKCFQIAPTAMLIISATISLAQIVLLFACNWCRRMPILVYAAFVLSIFILTMNFGTLFMLFTKETLSAQLFQCRLTFYQTISTAFHILNMLNLSNVFFQDAKLGDVSLKTQLSLLVLSGSVYTAIGGIVFTMLEREYNAASEWNIDYAVYFCVASFCTVGASGLSMNSPLSQALFPLYAIFGLLTFGMMLVSIRMNILELLSKKFSLKAYQLLTYWASGCEIGLSAMTEEQVFLSLDERDRPSATPCRDYFEFRPKYREKLYGFPFLKSLNNVDNEEIDEQQDDVSSTLPPVDYSKTFHPRKMSIPEISPLRRIRTTLSHASAPKLKIVTSIRPPIPSSVPPLTIEIPATTSFYEDEQLTPLYEEESPHPVEVVTRKLLFKALRTMLMKQLLIAILLTLLYFNAFSTAIYFTESCTFGEALLFTFNSLSTIGGEGIVLRMYVGRTIFIAGITSGLAVVAYLGSIIAEALSNQWRIHVEAIDETENCELFCRLMFNRLQSFVNQAVEVVAPQIKSKVDAMKDHWHYVSAFYEKQRQSTVKVSNVDETNVPFHLENMIKYIKEEEVEQAASDEPMTGPCLEELLQKKMLEQLVVWAEANNPPGMKGTVLKTFSLLISNIHHRLLPEASVRVPLERLINGAHTIENEPEWLPMKYELVKLINVVFRQLKMNPALLNLFIEEKKQGDKVKLDFPLLSYLFDYVASVDEKTAKIARESLIIGVQSMLFDERLVQVLVKHSGLADILVDRLIVFFSMLPAQPRDTSQHLKFISPATLRRKPTSSPKKLVPGKQLPDDERVIAEFFDYYEFLNELILSLRVNAKPHSNESLIKLVEDTLLNKTLQAFFKEVLLNRLLVLNEDDSIASTEYLTDILVQTRVNRLLVDVVKLMFTLSSREDSTPLVKLLVKRALSNSNEKLSVANLLLFAAILDTNIPAVFDALFTPSTETMNANEINFNQLVRMMFDLAHVGEDTLEEYVFDALEEQHALMKKLMDRKETEELGARLDIVSVIFGLTENFFFNSTKKNLVITKLLNKVLMYPKMLRYFSNRLVDAVLTLSQQSGQLQEEIPEFKKKLVLLKSIAELDLVDIITALNVYSFDAKTAEELSRSIESEEKESPKTFALDGPIGKISFSNFIPNMLLFEEFLKELSAVLVVQMKFDELNLLKV